MEIELGFLFVGKSFPFILSLLKIGLKSAQTVLSGLWRLCSHSNGSALS